MTDYKIAKVPFPIDKAKEIIDSYEKSKDTTGGFSVRYRMPKEMVKLTNEDVGAGVDESYGMGLGKAVKLSMLLQPRQMEGLNNAKGQGKAYNLVLSRKQLKAMKGQGLFSSILSAVAGPIAELAVGAIKKKIEGKGEDDTQDYQQEQPEDIAAETGGRYSNEQCIMEPTDCDICPHCKGSGLIPLLMPLLDPIINSLKKQPHPPQRMQGRPPPPKMQPMPPPPQRMPKNFQGAPHPQIGM